MDVSTAFPSHDPLGIQATYSLEILDENDERVSSAELGGVDGLFRWPFPPQSIQIRRAIRADAQRDIASGASVTVGGEGLGRVVLQGTYGVGQQKDIVYPTGGKQVRDAVVVYFQAFLAANDERGRVGKPGLRMLFSMTGGLWSEPDSESYMVWPETFPVDSRAAGRPHAWDWTCSLILLAPWASASPVDWSTIPDPATLAAETSAMSDFLGAMESKLKRARATLQKVNDLRSNLLQVSTRITDFVNGAQEAIYEITDLARGSAQIARTILETLDPNDFQDTTQAALRGALYEVRQLLGKANLTATSFKVSGAVSSSFTPRKTASLSRPVSVALSVGDTLASVAAKHLGDSSLWPDLVTVNDLEFPFVDFSGTNGHPGAAYDGMRVLGATDILKLPLPATTSSVGVSEDPIGSDLPDVPVFANTLQSGADNLKAALIRRLVTPKGRIPWHPDYGSILKRKIGDSLSMKTTAEVLAEVLRCLRSDHRVLDIRSQSTTADVTNSSIRVQTEVVSPLGILPLRAPLLLPPSPPLPPPT